MDSLIVQKKNDYSGHTSAVYGLITADDQSGFYSLAGDGWLVKWSSQEGVLDGMLIASTDAKLFCGTQIKGSSIIVTGDMHGHLYWIDTGLNHILKRSAYHKGSVFDVYSYSPDILISVSGDGFFCVWNTKDMQPVFSRRLSTQGLRCITHDINTDTLYIGSSDNHIYMIDTKSWNQIGIIKNAHKNSVFSMTTIADRYLISGSRDAHFTVRHLIDNEEVCSEPGHWYTINKILYIAEMQILVTASRDKTVRIWDAENFSLLKTLDVQKGGHFNSVNSLAWIPDRHTLISAGDDRVIKSWKVERF
ncbi:MAG: hypothetical protein WAU01_13895 [Saprospiraceae bacterium]